MTGIKRKQILDTPETTSTKKIRVESNKSSKSVSNLQPSKKPPRAREQLRTKPIKSDITGDENSFEGFSDNQEDERFEREASFGDAISDHQRNKTTAKPSNRMLLLNHFTSSVLTQTQNPPRRCTQNRKSLPKSAKQQNQMLIRYTELRRFGKDCVSNPMYPKKRGNNYLPSCLKS